MMMSYMEVLCFEMWGKVKFEKFQKDMKQLEIVCNFKMLPDAAENLSNTKVFSEQEKCEYLKKNGKYNKK